jgi:hypothetical protein
LEIQAALIGLLGVFVGGLVTAGANWLLAVRREANERATAETVWQLG